MQSAAPTSLALPSQLSSKLVEQLSSTPGLMPARLSSQSSPPALSASWPSASASKSLPPSQSASVSSYQVSVAAGFTASALNEDPSMGI